MVKPDALSASYLESVDDSKLHSLVKELQQEESDGSVETFELSLRTEMTKRIQLYLESSSPERLDLLGETWVKILHIFVHLLFYTERADEANKSADGDQEMAITGTETQKENMYPNIKKLRRQFPFLLLENLLDSLVLEDSDYLWVNHVQPNAQYLFDDTSSAPLWTKQHSWLPFLKLANQQLRRYAQASYDKQAASLMHTMAVQYPLSEKSAIKVWGSHNVDNVTDFETEYEFEEHKDKTSSNAAAGGPSVTVDYSFYQAFWKLQQDFHNPYTVSVADFVQRLETFFAALTSHKPDDLAGSKCTTTSLKYLTKSRLLVLQLQDVDFRIHVLTQFLFMAHHLTSQVASLGPRLSDFVGKAEQLLQQMAPTGPEHLRLVKALLQRMEPSWRKWKQNKGQPDLDHSKSSPAAKDQPCSSRKRLRTNYDAPSPVTTRMRQDLPNISAKLREAVPTLDDHLEDYIEALDPDAGIEPEYHPSRDKLCMWRAMRLLADQHCDELFKVGPNGDLEPMVRSIYSGKREIPGGPGPVYPSDEEEEDEKKSDEEQETTDGDGDKRTLNEDEDDDMAETEKERSEPDVEMSTEVEPRDALTTEEKQDKINVEKPGPEVKQEEVTADADEDDEEAPLAPHDEVAEESTTKQADVKQEEPKQADVKQEKPKQAEVKQDEPASVAESQKAKKSDAPNPTKAEREKESVESSTAKTATPAGDKNTTTSSQAASSGQKSTHRSHENSRGRGGGGHRNRGRDGDRRTQRRDGDRRSSGGGVTDDRRGGRPDDRWARGDQGERRGGPGRRGRDDRRGNWDENRDRRDRGHRR